MNKYDKTILQNKQVVIKKSKYWIKSASILVLSIMMLTLTACNAGTSSIDSSKKNSIDSQVEEYSDDENRETNIGGTEEQGVVGQDISVTDTTQNEDSNTRKTDQINDNSKSNKTNQANESNNSNQSNEGNNSAKPNQPNSPNDSNLPNNVNTTNKTNQSNTTNPVNNTNPLNETNKVMEPNTSNSSNKANTPNSSNKANKSNTVNNISH